MNRDFKIITLGGVEEIGINSTIIENEKDIIVIDFGLGFSEESIYGIDFLIPNFDYLQKNKDKIRGFIITHGHMDHIGGLPYVLEALNFPPIYGTRITLAIIKDKISEYSSSVLHKTKFIEFMADDKFNIGSYPVSFFRVNHNIPDSVGVVIKTVDGNIIHTGDFKFDNTPFEEPVTEYGKLAKLSEEGVLLLLSDSTNATKSGMSISESSITPVLENIIFKAEGRVIAATFSSLLTRVNQLVTIAQKYDRKIAISGSSMETTVKIAQNLGYLKIPKSIFIKMSDVKKYPDNKILIITTGAQGEENAGLMKMILGDHPYLTINKNDTVILSSSVIPTNGVLVQKLLDYMVETGANVIHQSIMDVHAGGHAHQEDHKLLINLLHPKYFMPIEGYQSFLSAHIKTVKSVGINENNILLPKDGSVFEYNGSTFIKKERIKHTPIHISDNTLGDFGNRVLKEREQLSEYGLILISIDIDKNFKINTSPNIISRGFIFSKENYKMVNLIEKKVSDFFIDKNYNSSDSLQNIRTSLTKYIQNILNNKFHKNPLILIVINNSYDK
ncbi:ribonuclease J [Patescibacteria group bacterium]|nr:ribonuclease J [Patescibacteria group bacterium]